MNNNIIYDDGASYSIAVALIVLFVIILSATVFPEIKDTITTFIRAFK